MGRTTRRWHDESRRSWREPERRRRRLQSPSFGAEHRSPRHASPSSQPHAACTSVDGHVRRSAEPSRPSISRCGLGRASRAGAPNRVHAKSRRRRRSRDDASGTRCPGVRQLGNVQAVATTATPELAPEGKLAAGIRLRAGASCRRGRALRGRLQPRERGRGARALAGLHRGRILLATGGAVNRPLPTVPTC